MVPALFSSLFLPVAILFLKSHSNSTETHRVPDERVLGRAVKLQALFQNVYTAVSSLSLGAVFPFYFIFLSFFSYSFCYFSERATNAGQRYFEAPVVMPTVSPNQHGRRMQLHGQLTGKVAYKLNIKAHKDNRTYYGERRRCREH